ncbi:hypothetical protein [Psychrobacter sp. PAMC 21119]|uniref:hypothetical protein n=1 Tax=Psychrobacter sp. PAMC 21119 TaxID=1112209 RepID=UPI0002892BCF|nr:hypothetical protein [Psychrobacter sp. PAMC 21119]
MRNIYLNAVRTHVDLLYRRGRTDKLIVWDVGTDETHDPTLIAYRVYGNRDDADVVMVCAGTNRIGEALPNRRIYLPMLASLTELKRSHIVKESANALQ